MTRRYLLVIGAALLLGWQGSALAQYPFKEVWLVPDADTLITGNAGRGVLAGTDVDQDGKPEVMITDYSGHRVTVLEVAGDNTMEIVWQSPEAQSAYKWEPRWIQVGDLDGNGRQEIIFPVGRDQSDTARGYHVYEWDGSTDDGYGAEPLGIIVPNPDAIRFRPENFYVGDVDADGNDELVHLEFGFLPEDAIRILNVVGSFSGGFFATQEEFKFDTGSAAPPWAPSSYIIADADGDGTPEIWVAGNGRGNPDTYFMNIEATGTDTYQASAVAVLTADNDYPLKNGTALDLDSDGKDDVFFPLFKTHQLAVLPGIADASQFTLNDLQFLKAFVDSGNVLFKMDHWSKDSGIKSFLTSGYSTGVWEWTYKGGSVSDSASYDIVHLYRNPFDGSLGGDPGITGGFQAQPDDIDGDGLKDIIVAYQGVPDSVHTLRLRMIEETPTGVESRDVTVITPDDYILEQNYPNPFNPSTTIRYQLPIRKQVTVRIYNELGQLVKTLVDHVTQEAGRHQVVWDGTDSNGQPVASGTYIYSLEYGNFRKTKRMTLLK